MTAIELIRKLVEADPDAEVVVEEYGGPKITLVGVQKNGNYEVSIEVEVSEEDEDE